jgi:ArsR family transcriptional regulator
MKNKAQKLDSIAFAKVLADSTRQQIMECCCCEWLSVTQIVDAVNVSQPTVSHHLAVLREAGLVESKDKGKHTFYTLNQERVAVCCGQLLTSFAPESKAAASLVKLSSIR